MCAAFSSSSECCLNYKLAGYCIRPAGLFAPGNLLEGNCARSCNFCTIDGLAAAVARKSLEYDASRSNPRLLVLINSAASLIAIGVAILIVALVHARLTLRRRQRRRLCQIAFFLSSSISAFVAASGINLVDLRTPSINISDILINDFIMETGLVQAKIVVDFQISLSIEKAATHFEANLQEVLFDLNYMHDSSVRRLGIAVVPATVITAGTTTVITGLVNAKLDIDPVLVTWVTLDSSSGNFKIVFGPNDINLELHTDDPIFEWLVGINHQMVSYTYSCDAILYTDSQFSRPSASPTPENPNKKQENAAFTDISEALTGLVQTTEYATQGLAHTASGGLIGTDIVAEHFTGVIGNGYDVLCTPVPDEPIDLTDMQPVAEYCLAIATIHLLIAIALAFAWKRAAISDRSGELASTVELSVVTHQIAIPK